jgi:RHS repeat-associated protein
MHISRRFVVACSAVIALAIPCVSRAHWDDDDWLDDVVELDTYYVTSDPDPEPYTVTADPEPSDTPIPPDDSGSEETTGSGSASGTDSSTDACNGVNSFTAHNGSAKRWSLDLNVAGAAGKNGLMWMRIHNTVARSGATPFGKGGSWRHNWQFDLQESLTGEVDRPTFSLTTPAGVRRVLIPSTSGQWIASEDYPERAQLKDDGLELTLGSGQRIFFRKVLGQWLAQIYYGSDGLATHLDYDACGNLIKVTEPAGRTLSISYRAMEAAKGNWLDIGEVKQAPVSDQWVELVVPVRKQQVFFNALRLSYKTTGQTPDLAEVQFFAPTSSQPMPGQIQSANGVIGFDLTGKASCVERIRIRARSGTEAALAGLSIQGFILEGKTIDVISGVAASDGHVVEYEYEKTTDALFQWRGNASLVRARYDDGTEAHYTYANDDLNSRPLLAEADEPRYIGRAKKIRYTYQQSGGQRGMIHQEINPANGSIYATLSIDPNNPTLRRVEYADLKITFFELETDQKRVHQKTDALGRTTRFEYANKSSRIKAKVDHKDVRIEYAHDKAGNLTLSKRQGKTEKGFERDAAGWVRRHQDRQGRITEYTRNDKGLVTKIARPDGSKEEFSYNEYGRWLSHKHGDGRVDKREYGSRGLLTRMIDADGNSVRFEYDKQDRHCATVDQLGRKTVVKRDSRGKITGVGYPDGTKLAREFDKYGRMVAQTDRRGQTTKAEYDDLGRIVRSIDDRGRVTAFDYTELPQGCGSCTLIPRPSRITHDDGRIEQNLYDTGGRLLTHTIAAGTPEQATTSYTYDDDDNLIAISDPLGRMTRFTYDDEHQRLSTTDPMGRATLYAYDDAGNVVSTTTPDGAVVKNEYDINNRLIKTIGADGHTTRFAYDALGNVTQVVDALGQKTHYEYKGSLRTATIYADGTRQTVEYDAAGRIVKIANADGAIITTTYDFGNRVLNQNTTVNGQSSTVANTYDSLGYRMSTTDALGRTTKFTYDTHGNVLTITLPDGSVTANTYDAQDHVLTTTDAMGQITHYTYDAADHLSALTDANGSTYRFTYDGVGRKTAMIYPDDSKESWVCDDADQMVGYTNRSGQTKTISYNLAGQPVSEVWSASTTPQSLVMPVLASSAVYSYDSTGRLNGIDNGCVKLSYVYEKHGRLASETSNVSALIAGLPSQTVGYRYDDLGRRQKLIYPDGSRVLYRYDVRNRLVSVDNDADNRDKPLAVYGFDPLGRIARLTRDNGVSTTYQYDVAGQLTEITHANGGQTLASSRYDLDLLGRRTAQTREDNITEHYVYDAISQLTQVDYGTGKTEGFTYDPVGNRSQATAAVNVTSYSTNSLNQYTRVNGIVLSYDANGNLIHDGKFDYQYDSQNRLLSVTSTSSVVQNAVRAEFAYDAKNRCILRKYYSKGSQGQWVLSTADSRALTYDSGWNLLSECTFDGRQVGKYIFGQRTDEILSAQLGVKTYVPLVDGLGSTVALTSNNGQVAERYRATACGTPTVLNTSYHPRLAADATSYRFIFTGREWLDQVQLNDHRNRFYIPKIARWLNPDPIRFYGGDLNLYRYVGNGIANEVDGYGLDAYLFYDSSTYGHVGLGVDRGNGVNRYDGAPTDGMNLMVGGPAVGTLQDVLQGKDTDVVVIPNHELPNGRMSDDVIAENLKSQKDNTGNTVGDCATLVARVLEPIGMSVSPSIPYLTFHMVITYQNVYQLDVGKLRSEGKKIKKDTKCP